MASAYRVTKAKNMDRRWFTLKDDKTMWAFIDESSGNRVVCCDFIEAVLRAASFVQFRASPQGMEYTLGNKTVRGSPQTVIRTFGLPIEAIAIAHTK